jgi:hypothetical protein
MSGKSEEGCVRAAVLTEDGGDSGAPIDFTEGETVAGAPNGRRVSAGGGGSSWAHWSEARRSGVEEIKGEEGVRRPLERRAARHVERGARGHRVEGRMKEGPGSVAPHGGAGSWQGAQAAASRASAA